MALSQANQLRGERLLTDRAYYADIDEAQGDIVVAQNFLRAGVPSIVGRYSLSDFPWLSSILRIHGQVAVANTGTSALIPDPNRPAVQALNVAAFVAAPLIREGRLVAALCVTDLSPRAWSTEEVELVRDTAERTRDAIERARAEQQLRDADARKDEFLCRESHRARLRSNASPYNSGRYSRVPWKPIVQPWLPSRSS